MFKKLGALFGLGLLALGGCGKEQTKTFVSESVAVPEADDPDASQDFDEDGTRDNSFIGLAGLLGQAGIDVETQITDLMGQGQVLIGVDVTSKKFDESKAVTVKGYLA